MFTLLSQALKRFGVYSYVGAAHRPHGANLPAAAGCFITTYYADQARSCVAVVKFLDQSMVNASMNSEPVGQLQNLRETARFALRHGDTSLAEQSYLRLLAMDQADIESLQQLASIHLSRHEVLKAIELLDRAARAYPSDPHTLHQLGTAKMTAGDIPGAIAELRKALAIAPHMFVARLRLSIMLDQLGETHEALVACFSAINIAQAQGRWLSDETTAPELRDVVRRAIQYVQLGRRSLFDGILEPLYSRYGRSEMARVERSLAVYLGEQAANIPDPRQQPKFLYFPDIPSQPYYPKERFPWIESLEAGAASIRAELLEVLSAQSLESWRPTESPQEAPQQPKSSGTHAPAWDAYFFHRHGKRYDEHCRQCPQTASMLDSLPLAYVRDHSPETLYSVLSPGTHILPHRGVTNTRLVTHLPLIVPADCALRVGGETHVWEEGRCVTFDDTFEHEAWNRSAETRVVLIVDSWNPDLTEAERAAVAELVGAIGDFNRSCELPLES
jgi:aspartate beta-hydroxylase